MDELPLGAVDARTVRDVATTPDVAEHAVKVLGTFKTDYYFAQISDSTTSYGSYSGAVPNEKITWYKIDANTPRFMIQSDATIVAPLIFSYVLGD